MALSSQQQEIVALLQQEVAEFATADGSVFSGGSAEEQQQLLQEWVEDLEPIVGALEIAGLKTLQACCQFLTEQFQQLSEACPCHEDVVESLQSWALFVLAYLHNLGSDDENSSIEELLEFLSQNCWPKPLTQDLAASWRAEFHDDQLDRDDEGSSHPTVATEAMADLSYGVDVHRDLIEGLHIELPEQARQFEQSVDAYLQSHLLNDLSTAQRMAHTLKGTGHIVEVMGIAHLMHFTEDLLEAAAKGKTSLPKNFSALLIQVADCLAAISEYLCENGEAPDNVQDVLQLLLDAIHQSDGTDSNLENSPNVSDSRGTSDGRETSPPEMPTAQTPPAAEKSSDHDEKQRLTINESTAQELLRLAGEIQIGHGRSKSQIADLQNTLAQVDEFQRRIREMANELENLVESQSAQRAAALNDAGELDPLEMERFGELHTFSNRLAELSTDSFETVQQLNHQLRDLSDTAYNQQQLNQDNQQQLLQLRMVSVDTFAARFTRGVRQACRLTNKEVDLTIVGSELRIDSRVLTHIASPILHLLRNAVDHGIEDGETRFNEDKETRGHITLSFAQSGETITIQCQDDGGGLDYTRIQQKAIEQGLLKVGEEASHHLLNQIILTPGFSTRTQVTQTSGRGIGLDAVACDVKSLKGQLSVTSVPGKNCCFTLVIPSSILTSHALVVRTTPAADSQCLSLVSRHIEQVIYLDPEERLDLDCDDHWVFEEKRIPLYDINTLVNSSDSNHQVSTLLIVKKSDGQKVAVAVGAAMASQNLVIKPFNAYTYHPDGVIGATILGDGSVSPVINLPDLPGMNLRAEDIRLLHRQREVLAARGEEMIAPNCALIVDDSLSARRSLAQFVRDLGMEVLTAKDGFEAINVISERRPNLVLVDMEMPRMNGLELTAHLRSNQDTSTIPVIMITSRSTQKHRELAQAAGVNGYLNKPWSDEELLESIEKQIA